MKKLLQETRLGTKNLEEENTLELLERLAPRKLYRCPKGTKAVGSTCVREAVKVEISVDERVGVALSRAAHYVKTLPQRVEEVRKAAEEALAVARNTGGKSQ